MLPCPSKLLYKQLPDNRRLYAGGAGLLFLRWDGDLKEVSAEILRSALLNIVIQLE